MQSADKAFADAKVRKLPLLTYSTLIEEAVRGGYVSEEDRLILLDWQKDPEGWGAKNGFPKVLKTA
jgi:orotate phosphoribosyltransferase